VLHSGFDNLPIVSPLQGHRDRDLAAAAANVAVATARLSSAWSRPCYMATLNRPVWEMILDVLLFTRLIS